MKNKTCSVFIGVLAVLCFIPVGNAADVIKIGIVAPLSPPGGVETGQAIVDGAKIAAEEINQAGGLLGKKVETRDRGHRRAAREGDGGDGAADYTGQGNRRRR